MVKETENHALNKYDKGDANWNHSPDMQHIEERLVVRDEESNLDEYIPHDTATFIATDSGAAYDGDGTQWNKAQRDVDSLKSNSVSTGNISVESDQAIAHGGGDFQRAFDFQDVGGVEGAVNAAISALESNGSAGTVLIGPPADGDAHVLPSDFGGWEISGSMDISGAGRSGTRIRLESDITDPIITTPATPDDRTFSVGVERIFVTGPSDRSASTPAVFDFSNTSNAVLNHVRASDIKGRAVDLRGAWDSQITALKTEKCGSATDSLPVIDLDRYPGTSGTTGNTNNAHFVAPHIERYHHEGISMNDSAENYFVAMKIHGPTDSEPPAVVIDGADENKFIGCNFDSIKDGGAITINGGSDNVISGCSFQNGAKVDGVMVEQTAGTNTTLTDCHFPAGNPGGAGRFIRVDGGDVTVRGGRVDGADNTLFAIDAGGGDITLDGLDVENCSNAIEVTASGRIEVRNCEFNVDSTPVTMKSVADVYIHDNDLAYGSGPSVNLQGYNVTGRIIDNELNSGGINRMSAASVQVKFLDPMDLTSTELPQPDSRGYHDGTDGNNTNAEGPAYCDGSNWISLVDGGTIA